MGNALGDGGTRSAATNAPAVEAFDEENLPVRATNTKSSEESSNDAAVPQEQGDADIEPFDFYLHKAEELKDGKDTTGGPKNIPTTPVDPFLASPNEALSPPLRYGPMPLSSDAPNVLALDGAVIFTAKPLRALDSTMDMSFARLDGLTFSESQQRGLLVSVASNKDLGEASSNIHPEATVSPAKDAPKQTEKPRITSTLALPSADLDRPAMPMRIPSAITYADATNLANRFPERAAEILDRPLSIRPRPVHTDEQPNWAVATDVPEAPGSPPRQPPRERKAKQGSTDSRGGKHARSATGPAAPDARRGRRSRQPTAEVDSDKQKHDHRRDPRRRGRGSRDTSKVQAVPRPPDVKRSEVSSSHTRQGPNSRVPQSVAAVKDIAPHLPPVVAGTGTTTTTTLHPPSQPHSNVATRGSSPVPVMRHPLLESFHTDAAKSFDAAVSKPSKPALSKTEDDALTELFRTVMSVQMSKAKGELRITPPDVDYRPFTPAPGLSASSKADMAAWLATASDPPTPSSQVQFPTSDDKKNLPSTEKDAPMNAIAQSAIPEWRLVVATPPAPLQNPWPAHTRDISKGMGGFASGNVSSFQSTNSMDTKTPVQGKWDPPVRPEDSGGFAGITVDKTWHSKVHGRENTFDEATPKGSAPLFFRDIPPHPADPLRDSNGGTPSRRVETCQDGSAQKPLFDFDAFKRTGTSIRLATPEVENRVKPRLPLTESSPFGAPPQYAGFNFAGQKRVEAVPGVQRSTADTSTPARFDDIRRWRGNAGGDMGKMLGAPGRQASDDSGWV
ncbi:hypothetical protein PLICRDRAFT_198426 [Plicaturopsis crispa FD-325 SS-3]|nr:hypothetical protein PLICRDRAFT_198426 [Plicaturopsis crispa FD-325 SS-3]